MLKNTAQQSVLHVFMNLNLGGAESRIMDLFRSQDANILVNDFVIMTNEHCYFTDEVIAKGGQVHVIDSPRNSMIKSLWQLYQLLKVKPQYTALHAHTSYYSGLCVFIAFVAGISARITHARNTSTGADNLPTRIMLLVGRKLSAIFATSRFAISTDAGKFLYGNKAPFSVVPNAFDFRKIRHKQWVKEDEKLLYDLDPKVLNIVCVGRFYTVKNHFFLLDVMHQLAQKNNDFCLHLIGDGELNEAMQVQVQRLGLEKNVRFWGKRADVDQLLSLFDVMVMTSKSEGLGVAALEAQAAGLPCVLSAGIPLEADIGLGLCLYIDLSLPLDEWVDAIQRQALISPVSKVETDQQFERRGYSLSATRQRYLDAYLRHEKN
ncbi:glycosyltransferase [Cognaticolwellia beringensis]|uniref:Glycosyltransferase family 1 protein n=1 Tax=Cognaticolwellia beringensis TaxID=1967665 RepID=A0A222G822_9GAMM|nr:glycosyltransferase [Cognaticolwellia beringensis]ASP47882.1 glycosyltransferase family 1 protein [Cognaticolwellia beringensis]